MTHGTAARTGPLVLVVDDDPGQAAFAETIRDNGVAAVYAHPEDVTAGLLASATVVLLDQYLDEWPERASRTLPPSLTVLDGLSLAAVLRTHTDRSSEREGRPARPVAFALRTGELAVLAAGLPAGPREHLLAARCNLEWVFDKHAAPAPDLPSVGRRAAVLALAVAALPHDWGPGSGDPGLSWLGLPGAGWADTAAWQVEQCRPPQHVLADSTTGTAWLRWFLHRVLPYPTFLLDRAHTALMLGTTGDQLASVLDGPPTALTERLDAVRYTGGGAGFAGDRWWRAGVADFLRKLAREQAGPAAAAEDDEYDDDHLGSDPLDSIGPVGAAALASAAHGSPLEPVRVERPVLVLDADQRFRPRPVPAEDAVRLQPDGWPPYADDPWADRSGLESDEDLRTALGDLVVSTDRWRLPAVEDEGRSGRQPS